MDKIDELLTRGVDKIYPSKEELEKVLRSGKKLRIYEGFDPTGSQLHIGHMVGLHKLRQFQDLGHEVIFLIGDFTGMIGDPSGKFSERKVLTHEEVLENAKNYKKQVEHVLSFTGKNPVKIKYNGDWLGKMSAIEFFQLSRLLSYQQVVERDMFQKRMKKGQDLFMNEFLYPVFQAYDSVAMDVDLEIGGSDQMFNMMMGRHLMHKMKKKNKFVMTTPLLTDSQGNKIGKTEGNVIALTAAPNDLYGMIMNLGDDVIIKCFEYLTDIPMEEVKEMEQSLKSQSLNPMVFKKKLAFTLTKMLNDEKAAKEAQEEFERVHQQNQNPLYDILIYHIHGGENIIDVLVNSKLVTSRSEAKRLMEQNAVEIDNQKFQVSSSNVQLKDGAIIKVGKNRFLKIKYGDF